MAVKAGMLVKMRRKNCRKFCHRSGRVPEFWWNSRARVELLEAIEPGELIAAVAELDAPDLESGGPFELGKPRGDSNPAYRIQIVIRE
jgi:hypothetical protein